MKMPVVAGALTALGLVALGFGAWGRYTEAGRARFDEMAGMLPLASFYLGLVLLAAAAVLWGLALTRK